MTRPRAGSPAAQSQEAFSSFFEKWHSFFSWRASAEKQRSKLRQISAPNHPGVIARRLDVHVLDIFRRQPGAEGAVDFDQTVVCSARNPKQMQLLGGLRVQRGKFLAKIFGEPAKAEGANPAKLVESIQAGQQRFGAAHGKSGDGPGFAVFDYRIFLLDARKDFREQRF